jgi:hypothetical protein
MASGRCSRRRIPARPGLPNRHVDRHVIRPVARQAINLVDDDVLIPRESFALAAGLDRSYVGAIERGEFNLTLEAAQRSRASWAWRPRSCWAGPGSRDLPPAGSSGSPSSTSSSSSSSKSPSSSGGSSLVSCRYRRIAAPMMSSFSTQSGAFQMARRPAITASSGSVRCGHIAI